MHFYFINKVVHHFYHQISVLISELQLIPLLAQLQIPPTGSKVNPLGQENTWPLKESLILLHEIKDRQFNGCGKFPVIKIYKLY